MNKAPTLLRCKDGRGPIVVRGKTDLMYGHGYRYTCELWCTCGKHSTISFSSIDEAEAERVAKSEWNKRWEKGGLPVMIKIPGPPGFEIEKFKKSLRESLFRKSHAPNGHKEGVKFYTQSEMEEMAAREVAAGTMTLEEFIIWKAQCRHEI